MAGSRRTGLSVPDPDTGRMLGINRLADYLRAQGRRKPTKPGSPGVASGSGAINPERCRSVANEHLGRRARGGCPSACRQRSPGFIKMKHLTETKRGSASPAEVAARSRANKSSASGGPESRGPFKFTCGSRAATPAFLPGFKGAGVRHFVGRAQL